jgi:hypothetical protein
MRLRHLPTYIRVYFFSLKMLWITSKRNALVFSHRFFWHHKHLKIEVLDESWPKGKPPKITITELI